MNKKTILASVIVGIVIVGVMAVWAVKKAETPQPVVGTSQEQQNQNPQNGNEPAGQEPTTTPEVIASKIDTSDWKTYESTLYGFSFKYPKDWSVGYEYDYTKDVTKVNELVLSTSGGVPGGLFYLFDKEGTNTLNEFLNKKMGEEGYRTKKILDNGGYVVTELGGNVSWKYYSRDGEHTGYATTGGEYSFFYDAGNYIIVIFGSVINTPILKHISQTIKVK